MNSPLYYPSAEVLFSDETHISLFMMNRIPCTDGYFFKDILSYNNFFFEHDHKYIAYLFPTEDHRRIKRNAPVVTPKDIEVFKGSKSLQTAHTRALDRFLTYLGLTRLGRSLAPLDRNTFTKSKHHWLRPLANDHKRISRVLRSLTLLGNAPLASALYLEFVRIGSSYGDIDLVAHVHWRDALIEPNTL